MDETTFESLTDSQKACLRLVGQGMSSKEIARHLSLTPLTVDTYLTGAIGKMGASNRREAARRLAEWDGSQKSGSQSETLAESDPGSPDPMHGESGKGTHPGLLPPIGGRVNDLGISQRVVAACRIAFIATLALISVAMILREAIKVFS